MEDLFQAMSNFQIENAKNPEEAVKYFIDNFVGRLKILALSVRQKGF